MEWLFRDITETINVAEALWTAIGMLGVFLCTWMSAMRSRTLYWLFCQGINGQSRLIGILRLARVLMLGIVFLGFVVVGGFSMTMPTNPAVIPTDPKEAIPTLALIGMEFLLFLKLLIEEFLESIIVSMRDMKNAARHESTPRLSD